MEKLSNENALKKIIEILGDKYDYSKFEYKGYDKKVILICPIHGEFEIKYASIIQFKRGCPKCSIKFTTETWIEAANKIHNNKYDYSKVKYENNHTKVCIICSEHGEFWQLPNNHLQGQGCPKCYYEYRKHNSFGNGRKLTTEEFIERGKEIHDNKYDYSKVEYINAHTKVCIICPIHGEFWQSPNSHLKGIGCAECNGRKKLTTEEFIKRAKEIHGNKYDYSKVEYINNRTKVCIICPIHGEFWQSPSKHLDRKQGCPKCAHKIQDVNTLDNAINQVNQVKEDIRLKKQHLQDKFIEKSNIVHHFRYDYSKVNYIDLFTSVCIICPIHGEFWQLPNNHLHYKSGCPKCIQSLIEGEVETILKDNDIKFETYHHNSWLGMLSLDFLLFEYNIAIECQGGQHFIPVDFGGKGLDYSKMLFKSQIQRDLKKIELCKEHDIELIHYATCEVPDDFDLYEVITSEDELIKRINNLIEVKKLEND